MILIIRCHIICRALYTVQTRNVDAVFIQSPWCVMHHQNRNPLKSPVRQWCISETETNSIRLCVSGVASPKLKPPAIAVAPGVRAKP